MRLERPRVMLRSHGICALAALLLAHPSLAQSVSGDAFVPPTPAQLHAAATPSTDQTWWKHAVIYEIYPRSFQDSNGDGIGDLNGITQRLDYLQKLGIDAIWIAPMYPSPQVDFGYDISNYEAVDPQYGTLADFDRLLAAAKAKNIRIVLDMVLNHTSDQHPWFAESASSRSNPRADWYVWSDGKPAPPGTPAAKVHMGAHGPVVAPNNWISLFGGSAWEWVPARQQFYYHKFYKQQPDLNWRNPAVEGAMFAAMRFWLDRGVAGFRLDAVPTLFEDAKLRDEPIAAPGTNPQGDPNVSDIYTNMLPEVHDVLRRMRKMIDTYPDNRVLIGETYLPNSAALDQWYGGAAHNELQLPMDMLVGFHREGGVNARNVALDLPHFRQTLTEMETELNGNWPLLVFDNHDNTRSWDRFCPPSSDQQTCGQIARVIATMLLTTRSTALMYYGEELGMTTHAPTRVEDVRDPIGITGWPREKGRDGERTPMQWSGTEVDAGFSTAAQTWLPIGADAATINVATETADPHSLLNWYNTLIAMRRDKLALHNGGIVMLDTENPSVLSYARTAAAGAKPIVVSVNMTAQPQTIHLDLAGAGITVHGLKLLLSDATAADLTCKDCDQPPMTVDLTLPPYASVVAEVQ